MLASQNFCNYNSLYSSKLPPDLPAGETQRVQKFLICQLSEQLATIGNISFLPCFVWLWVKTFSRWLFGVLSSVFTEVLSRVLSSVLSRVFTRVLSPARMGARTRQACPRYPTSPAGPTPLDSIVVSLFVDIFVEFDKKWIKSKSKNNLMMRRTGLSRHLLREQPHLVVVQPVHGNPPEQKSGDWPGYY